MAQHDYVIANGTGAAVRSDLNNALAAIVSQNSGATEPATMYAYQWWADTSTGLLKLRNGANNAWITLRELDGTLTIEAGTVSAPGLAFASDLNTGVWSPGADQFAIATNGVERVEWGISEVVFNDGGTNYDFRVEGDTNANLLFVDASADAVGIGTAAPAALLSVASTSGATQRLSRTGLADGSGSDTATIEFANGTGAVSEIRVGGDGDTQFNTRAISTDAYATRLFIKGSTGNVGIGTTSPSALIHGKQDVDGISNILDLENSATSTGAPEAVIRMGRPGTANRRVAIRAIGATNFTSPQLAFDVNESERARIDSSGRLLVGTSTARSVGTLAAASQYEIEGTSSATSFQSLICNANGSAGPGIVLGKSRSTSIGGTTIVSSGDTLGRIHFEGADGTNLIQGAAIVAEVDGTPGANDMPGRIVLSTTADGASSPTERMRIDSRGAVRTGNNTLYTGTTGAVTASTGTTVFTFDFSGTTTRHTALVKLSVMHLVATNSIAAQPAAEYIFAVEGYTTGVSAATAPTAVFQNVYVAATHFAFADTGNTSFTITLTNPSASAASAVYYKVEVLDNAGALNLSSVTTT